MRKPQSQTYVEGLAKGGRGALNRTPRTGGRVVEGARLESV